MCGDFLILGETKGGFSICIHWLIKQFKSMKYILTALLLILSYQVCHTQSTWEYYSSEKWIQNVEIIDDKAYVATPLGLTIVDIETGEHKMLNSTNSEVKGCFIWETIATDDAIWMALDEGGIAKYTIGEGNSGSWEQYCPFESYD